MVSVLMDVLLLVVKKSVTVQLDLLSVKEPVVLVC